VSLRKIIFVLLAANLGYFAYSQDWLSPLLGSDISQREPERVSHQVNHAMIEVGVATMPPPRPVAPAAIQPPAEPKPSPLDTCASKLEQWLVYMGPYASKSLSDKKKSELTALGLRSTPMTKLPAKWGLSLGQFESEAAARAALKGFASKGVKTATVVLWDVKNCP
jgi:hypothetical protein